MQSTRVTFADTECVLEPLEVPQSDLKIVVTSILHRSHPIILGVKVLSGVLVADIILQAHIDDKVKYLGEVLTLEKDQVDVREASPSDDIVSVKIDSHGVDVHLHHDLVGLQLTQAKLRMQVVEVFHKKNPLILGVNVEEGMITPGTRLEIDDGKHKVIGAVVSLEKDHEPISIASADSKLGEIGVMVEPTEESVSLKHAIKAGIKVVEHKDDILDMEETKVIHSKNPVIISCKIHHGVVREGDVVELTHKDMIAGKVVSIERDHKRIHSASASDDLVGVKIQPTEELQGILDNKHARKSLTGQHITKLHFL